MPPLPHRRAADCRIVALLTDFGVVGHHAGVLRGVILGINRRARLADLTHGIPAGDVALGAWTLRWSWRHFPTGTVHLAVVDPGVGTSRRALAAAAGGRFFVGPDNGLLSYALRDAGSARVVALPPPDGSCGLSRTFQGRDLFAPVAARLACGEPLSRLGPPVRDWVCLPEPRPCLLRAGRIGGEVIAVDHWGNLITSLTEHDLARARIGPDAAVRVGRRVVRGIRRTYADARHGGAIALINSNGHLELAVNQGRADQVLSAGNGSRVCVSD